MSVAYYSPLRYPGGKASLSPFLKEVIVRNNIVDGIYCEAYAGGAGAALELLFSNTVNHIILNDADYHIYSFWNTILTSSNEFIDKLKSTSITLEQWFIEKNIYNNPDKFSELEIGFATFFLNRCNRAGILPNAGPIGGYKQNGNYSIEARFKKENLINRIISISKVAHSITLYNLDALELLKTKINSYPTESLLLYLDPPYYKQGRNLYLNFYEDEDHKFIHEELKNIEDYFWLVSYDNAPEIKEIYNEHRMFPFDLNYSLQEVKQGKELMIFSDNLSLPDKFKLRKKEVDLII